MYRDCARKWAWRYIAGIKAPPSPAAALGVEVDDTQIQPYLRDGRPLDFTRSSGEIAQALVPYLPTPPIPPDRIQKQFHIESEDSSFGFVGYIDLFTPGPVPTVTDTKTCGSFEWIRTEKDLETDVQAQLYATATFLETGAPAVDLEWLYTRTRGARAAKRVTTRVTPESASAQYAEIHATAEEMLAVRRTADALAGGFSVLSLPPTPESCSKYGGCPYQHECNLSPSHFRKVDVMSSSVLERLRAKKAAQQAGQSATETSVTSSTTPGPAAAGTAPVAPPPSPPMSDTDVPAPEKAPASTESKVPYTGNAKPLGINPPEKDLSNPLSVATTAPVGGGPQAGAVAGDKPKRHRRTKAEMEAARAAAAPPAAPEAGGAAVGADNADPAPPGELQGSFAASTTPEGTRQVVIQFHPDTIAAMARAFAGVP